MITQVSDYTQTNEFYRIPAPIGSEDTAALMSAIAEGERVFFDTFGFDYSQGDPELTDEQTEALKFVVFSEWLRWQTLRKTSTGIGAKNRFTQSDSHYDQERRVQAWNRACVIMQKPEKKMLKIFNY